MIRLRNKKLKKSQVQKPPIPQKPQNDAIVIVESQNIFQKVPIYAWIFVIIIVIIIIVIIGYFLLKSNDSSSNNPTLSPTNTPTRLPTYTPTNPPTNPPTNTPTNPPNVPTNPPPNKYGYLYVSGISTPGDVTLASNTRIPFNYIIKDDWDGTWDINPPNYMWTCPLNGYYIINVSIFVNVGNVDSIIKVIVNNNTIQNIGNANVSLGASLPMSSFTYLFTKGDNLDIRTTQEITIFNRQIHTSMQICYTPQTFAYLYVSGSGGDVSLGAGARIPFNNIVKKEMPDTWDVNTYVWTCPLDGYYTINTSIFIVNTTGDSRIWVVLNGVGIQYIGNVLSGNNQVALPMSSFTYPFMQGDQVDIRTTQAITIYSKPIYTSLQIHFINQLTNPEFHPYLYVSGGDLGQITVKPNEQIPFSNVIFNDGGNIWNTNLWICPRAGYYTINTFIFVVSNISGQTSRIAIYINNMLFQYIGNVLNGTTELALPMSSFTYFFNKDDTVDIRTSQEITIWSAPIHTALQIYYTSLL